MPSSDYSPFCTTFATWLHSGKSFFLQLHCSYAFFLYIHTTLIITFGIHFPTNTATTSNNTWSAQLHCITFIEGPRLHFIQIPTWKVHTTLRPNSLNVPHLSLQSMDLQIMVKRSTRPLVPSCTINEALHYSLWYHPSESRCIMIGFWVSTLASTLASREYSNLWQCEAWIDFRPLRHKMGLVPSQLIVWQPPDGWQQFRARSRHSTGSNPVETHVHTNKRILL